MTKLRQLWLLTALGTVAALAGGYFLLVSPRASKAADIRAQTETQERTNAKLRSDIAQLNAQKKDLPRQQAALAKFATKIPDNPALPALIRALSDAAENAGVELVSMAPGAVTVVGSPAGATTTAAGVTTSATLPLAQMPIAVQVTGNYSQVSQFLSEIEGLPRAFLVNGFGVAPGDSSAAGKTKTSAVSSDILTVSMTGQLFMTTKVAPVTVAPKTAATTAAK